MIGVIRLVLTTPYSTLMRHYSGFDFDVIGVYYEQELKISTVFYDIYSGQRLPSAVTVGDVFYWKSLVSAESERYEVMQRTEEIVIASLLLTTIDTEESLTRLMGTGRSQILDKFWSYDLSGRYYESTLFQAQSSVKTDIPLLDSFYDELHTLTFDLLRRRSLKGFELFPYMPTHPRGGGNLEKKLKSAFAAKVPTLTVSQDECDLGVEDFQRTIVVEYKTEKESFVFETDRVGLVLINARCDLRLLETQAIRDLFHYMETFPTESYTLLRKSLLEEMIIREQK